MKRFAHTPSNLSFKIFGPPSLGIHISSSFMEAASVIDSPVWAIASKWPLKPQFLKLVSPRGKRNAVGVLPRCSAKPKDTDERNSAKERHSDFSESLPVSSTEQQRQGMQGSGVVLSSVPTVSRGLVFDLGKKDSWDCLEIGSPVVKRYLGDEEERWYMWYHGRSGGNNDSIGLATSSNGIHWERGTEGVRSNADVGLVMSTSKDWWAFDTYGVRPCEVVMMSSAKIRANSSVYWLYYTGFSTEKISSFDHNDNYDFKSSDLFQLGIENGRALGALPGLAMSQDGRHWARIEGEHHSGALLDVGTNDDWDSLFIASPHVVFHGPGDLRMYYHSLDRKNGHFAVGVARSRDGMKWIKLGKILGGGKAGAFDERGVLNARVVRNQRDGCYLMVYEGLNAAGDTSIGVAASADGLRDWRRLQDGPILEKSDEGGWDSHGVGSPCLVQMDGDTREWRMYYRGVGEGGRSGLGLAVSQDYEVNNFRRWTGFQL